MTSEAAHSTDAGRQRCREVIARLAALYEWALDEAGAEGLAAEMLAAAGAEAADLPERQAQQLCCRLRFAALFRGLTAGGPEADQVLRELFSVRWVEDGSAQTVRYGGFLYRSALLVLRRRLSGHETEPAALQQLGADAAGRALTTVQARFGDCRDENAFWGWTARVAERAAIDELRSGRATGGSSVHAASLDELAERGTVPDLSPGESESRHVDAMAVQAEFLRKCRLGLLSSDQREALVRSFWRDEKPREIAAALSESRGSAVTAAQVSLWKHRGLQVMEANLREHGFS